MKVIENKENFLLNRREVKIVVGADKNPSYDEAMNIIAREFKAEAEKTAIKLIKGKFGRNTFLISAFIYKNKEDKEKLEKKKEKKKAGEQATQAKTETAQTQAKTEEKK